MSAQARRCGCDTGSRGGRRRTLTYLRAARRVLFSRGDRAAAGHERLHQLHQLDRGRAAAVGRAWPTTGSCCHDSEFWASIWHSLALVAAMAVDPGGRRADRGRRPVRRHRQAVRPAGGRACCGPASTCRRCCRSSWPRSSGAGSWTRRTARSTRCCATPGWASLAHDLLGDPQTALLTVMAVLVWFQLGYPVVIFMAALQRADPAARRGGRDRRRVAGGSGCGG